MGQSASGSQAGRILRRGPLAHEAGQAHAQVQVQMERCGTGGHMVILVGGELSSEPPAHRAVERRRGDEIWGAEGTEAWNSSGPLAPLA